MTETFIALLFAHTLADFLLQTKAMVDGKQVRRAAPLLLHTLVVLAATVLATGSAAWPLLALAAAHLAIDLAKSRLGGPDLMPFLADQAAHLASIAALALWMPGLWAGGLWSSGIGAASAALIGQLMAYGAGALLAIRAGEFAVGKLMMSLDIGKSEGLPQGGLWIGRLERGLIFLLIVIGQGTSIGFLIAAKSVLRFGAVNENADGAQNRAASEYVIIGTLASFGWAIAASAAALALIAALPTP